MQIYKFTLGLAILSGVSALELISPTLSQKIDRSSTFNVSWKSVSTDATSFVLAARLQGDSNPDAVKKISNPIPTSAGNITLAGSVLPAKGNWTIYALTNNAQRGILAQSQLFEATGETKKESNDSKAGLSSKSPKGSDSGKSSSTTDASSAKSGSPSAASLNTFGRYPSIMTSFGVLLLALAY